MTTYRIGDIRPNPFRNIDRYPINREKVAKLKESIGRTDFWDNLVARAVGDGGPDTVVEIAYGHHRLVALRELYPPEHEVGLILRDLADVEMLHMMADENMQEWASDIGVQKETVRAVRDFLVGSNPKVSTGGRPPENGSIGDIGKFLGWPGWRVKECVGLLLAEQAEQIRPEDTAGLALDTAAVLRRNVVKIKDPSVRRQAIARVRDDLQKGRIGSRGIGEVVREVREEAEPPKGLPRMPMSVALEVYRAIDGFFRMGVAVNRQTMTRLEAIRVIAENRDAAELQGLAGPMADQVADALLEMARQAERLASELRSEPMLTAGGVR